jgi:diguanylate cyclase (GGDEF)-like protein
VSRPDPDDHVEAIAKLRRRLERERHTRLEAERIAEKGLRELYDKQQQLQLLEKIAVAANESSSLPDALQLALSLICEFTGWMLGHAYVTDPAEQSRLISTSIWEGTNSEHLQEFKQLSEKFHFTVGTGLPGRVRATGVPVWIKDVTADDNFPRREAACAVGIRTACAFPVLVESEVVAVVEFFSEQVVEPNELLLHLMSQIGTQLGRVVERKRAADQRIAVQTIRLELHQRLQMDEAEDKLREQNARLDAALTNMPHGLCMFDADKRLVLSNSRYAEMYNLPPALVVPGTPLQDIIEYRQQIGNAPRNFPNYVTHDGVEFRVGNNSLFEFALEDGRKVRLNHLALRGGGYVATHEDVTEAMRAETRISHMAGHDALTNLPNRVLFREKLQEALRRVSLRERAAVLYIDLDHFKEVNDTLGHPAGDALLSTVANRLRDCVNPTDTIARLGGDEFAIVQVSTDQPSAAAQLAHRVIEVVRKPCDLDGNQVVIDASIGIALAPEHGNDPDKLLKNADMALYRAKSNGRGLHCFFESAMDTTMQARRRLEIGLRRAIAQEEFELHYQPLVNLRDNSVTGFEALLRWRDPDKGMVSPAEFIPLAEETGLIVPIGAWVIRRACADAATWPGNLRVAVNLSAVQFKGRDLITVIFGALAASQLLASRLELEITESVLLNNNEATLAMLHQLRDFGVRVSMDDFGTGYSSLSYLRSFPFDKIKIDQSFIRDLGDSDDSLAIVRAVIGLGAALGMTITAEGVETSEQLDCLRREGCTEAQGFLLSRPRPLAQLEEFFSDPKWSSAVAA